MRSALILFVALALFVGMSLFLHKITNPEEGHNHDHDHNQAKTEEKTQVKKSPPATRLPGRIATVKTSKGDIRFVLYEKDMPITCGNFVKLVESGFYKNMQFHRVEDWVIQTGDPKGDGTGGSKDTIKLETREGINYNLPYMVGMARTEDPDSASSQFFITKTPYQFGNGQYACFGAVIDGQKVVDKIEKGDKFIGVTLSPPSEKDKELIKELHMKMDSVNSPLKFTPTSPNAEKTHENDHSNENDHSHDH